MALHPLALESADELEPWVEQWDALATAAGRPYSAPGWLLPWWENMRPPATVLRVVLLTDGASLVGVAPFFAQSGRAGRRDLRLLGCGTSHGLEILTARRDKAAVEAVASALADAEPSLVSFEGVEEHSFWPTALRSAWPGALRPSLLTTDRQATPEVTFDGDHERWLASRSSKLRKQIAQSQRRLERVGGRISLAETEAEREAAAAAFARLHTDRWSGRGGSNLPIQETGAMLLAATRRLSYDRLRLFTLVADGQIAAVQILVAAGGEVAHWNGGWDERHTRVQPGLLTLVAAVEDASRRGDRRLSLGGGAHWYKLRLADASVSSAVTTRVLVPVGLRYPQVRVVVLRQQLKRTLRRGLERLPDSLQTYVRAWLRRAKSAGRSDRP